MTKHNLRTTVSRISQNRRIRARALEVVNGRASVKISGSSQVLYALPITGGDVIAGQDVYVDYSSGQPVVHSYKEQAIQATTRNSTRVVTADEERQGSSVFGDTDLAGLGVTVHQTDYDEDPTSGSYASSGSYGGTIWYIGNDAELGEGFTGLALSKYGIYGYFEDVQKFRLFVEDGSIQVITGTIGGWNIEGDRIESLLASVGISMDSGDQMIRVGNITGDHIQVDGANQRIMSSNFVEGQTGMKISSDTGDAEFNNIVARGEMRTFLLTAENQMAVAGSIMVSKDSGKLGAAVTTSGSQVDFGKTMLAGDWIKIQGNDSSGNIGLEWMKILAHISGNIYSVTRNVDGSGLNAWDKDTPFAVIGQENDSRIEITSGSSGGIQLITQGAAWDSQTIQASMSTYDGAITAGGGDILIDADGYKVLSPRDGMKFYTSGSQIGEIRSSVYTVDDVEVPSLELYCGEMGDNLIINGDFDTDVSAWTTSGSPGVDLYSDGHISPNCLLVSYPPSGDGTFQSDYNALESSSVYNFSYYWKYEHLFIAMGGDVSIYLDEYNSSHNLVKSNLVFNAFALYSSKPWRNASESITTTGSTAYSRIRIDCVFYPPFGGMLYFDEFVLEKVTSPSYVRLVGTSVYIADDLYVKNSLVVNDDGEDFDTRFEGISQENLLFIDASTNRIGIGTNAPSKLLHVAGAGHVTTFTAETLDVSADSFFRNSLEVENWLIVDETFVANESGGNFDSRIEGDTDQYLFFVDASTDKVGIGTNVPSEKLHVAGSLKATGATILDDTLSVGGGAALGALNYGTYTPTSSNITNVSDSTPANAIWYRIGNAVTVQGRVEINTNTGGNAEIELSLPVASNFGNLGQCSGVAVMIDGAEHAGITADVTNDTAQLKFVAVSAAANFWYYQYTYKVI